MQTVALPKERNTASFIKQDDGRFRYFSMQDALPAGHILVLNTFSGTLSYLGRRNGPTPGRDESGPYAGREEIERRSAGRDESGPYLHPRARLIAQQQFSFSEMSLLLPLLEAYPHYCPHEVIYAHFYNSSVTEELITQYRQRLQNALESGSWEQEMRPMRNVLSRVRLKVRPFGMSITSILETGYMLMISSPMKNVRTA